MTLAELPRILYVLAVALTVTGWLALIIFPRRPWANFWYAGLIVPLLLSAVYSFACVIYFFYNPSLVGDSPQEPTSIFLFLTLGGLGEMFQNPGLLLAGFLDILAVDLFLGAWMARKAAQIGMPYVYLLPCLLLTFPFAGIGFILFVVLAGIGGGWPLISKFESAPSSSTMPVAAWPGARR